MKKIMIIAFVFITTLALQAQEKEVKNSFTDNGNSISATMRYDNGAVSQTGFFTKKGKLTGNWISYDREGNKTAEAQYDEGVKVGTWFFWKGETLTEVEYTNSRIATVHTWNNKDTRVVSND